MGETLRRWLRENTADTRQPNGPEPRVYEVPFAQVWAELLDFVENRHAWDLIHKDEELGLISVICSTLVFRFVDDVSIWVKLDENGLTRVEVLSQSRRGSGDLGVNERRVNRLLNALDNRLGSSTRLTEASGQNSDKRLSEETPADRVTPT